MPVSDEAKRTTLSVYVADLARFKEYKKQRYGEDNAKYRPNEVAFGELLDVWFNDHAERPGAKKPKK